MVPPAAEIDLARVLCRLADLPAQGSLEFRLGRGHWPLRGFVLRVDDSVRAWSALPNHRAFVRRSSAVRLPSFSYQGPFDEPFPQRGRHLAKDSLRNEKRYPKFRALRCFVVTSDAYSIWYRQKHILVAL